MTLEEQQALADAKASWMQTGRSLFRARDVDTGIPKGGIGPLMDPERAQRVAQRRAEDQGRPFEVRERRVRVGTRLRRAMSFKVYIVAPARS